MKALVCPSLGPAENLAVTEIESPTASDGEVLVEVAYAGLNFFDTLIIEGKYQVRPKPPFSPGGEFSGRVVALGPGAQGFHIGDRIMGACPSAPPRSASLSPRPGSRGSLTVSRSIRPRACRSLTAHRCTPSSSAPK